MAILNEGEGGHNDTELMNCIVQTYFIDMCNCWCFSLWFVKGYCTWTAPEVPRGDGSCCKEVQLEAWGLCTISRQRRGVSFILHNPVVHCSYDHPFSLCRYWSTVQPIPCYVYQLVVWTTINGVCTQVINNYVSSVCVWSFGDYPKLPDRSQAERDPWYKWDHPDLRRNWGEPVRHSRVKFL